MDQSETESDPRRQIPALVWLFLAVIVVIAFAALTMFLGRPSPVIAPETIHPEAAAIQGPPVRTPEPAKLD